MGLQRSRLTPATLNMVRHDTHTSRRRSHPPVPLGASERMRDVISAPLASRHTESSAPQIDLESRDGCSLARATAARPGGGSLTHTAASPPIHAPLPTVPGALCHDRLTPAPRPRLAGCATPSDPRVASSARPVVARPHAPHSPHTRHASAYLMCPQRVTSSFPSALCSSRRAPRSLPFARWATNRHRSRRAC